MSQPPAAVRAAAQSKTPMPHASEDKLVLLRKKAAEARDLELRIEQLDADRKVLSDRLYALYSRELPDLFDEVKLDNIGVPPEGNKPGVDYELKPYYSASIAAKWDPQRKQQAFDLLKKLKADELIKTQVVAKLPKGKLKQAKQLVAAAKKLGVTTELTLSVHAQTLTSWLRGLYEEKKQTLSNTQLETLGASVGRMVKPVERKDA